MEIIQDWSSNKSTREYLMEYIAPWEELEYQFKMLTFLKTEKPFDRENLEGHFTASAWIVTRDNSRALVTHHKKLGIILQLGGHCDNDHDILRVALRESIEESGISNISFSREIFTIGIHRVPQREFEPEHLHYDICFLFIVENNSEFIVSPESTKLEWITKDFDITDCTNSFKIKFNKWKDLDITNYKFESLPNFHLK
jgi:8-oxo-dGTP pyrophosphatase MutT (NUDIX family)